MFAFCVCFRLNAGNDSATGLAGVDVATASGRENVIFWLDWKLPEIGVLRTGFMLSNFADCVLGGVDGGAWAARGDIRNSWAADLSAIGCGGEQMSTCVGRKFNMLNDNSSPCVDRMWIIGMTGI